MTSTQRRQRRHTALLVLMASGMFGFSFALAPLYDVLCELTGLNGRTSGPAIVSAPAPGASDREVTIQFLAQVGTGMPWEFRPTAQQLRVRPGEMHTTTYYVRNRAAQSVIGQAVPSVTPGPAALYLHKTECFCFVQQRLDAGEEKELPVTFYVGTDLPENIQTLSLSYTLFPAGGV
jgi:cytochrome c oxidase assembly protein subunit 11